MARKGMHPFFIVVSSLAVAIAGLILGAAELRSRSQPNIISGTQNDPAAPKLLPLDLSKKGLPVGAIVKPITLVSLQTGETEQLFAETGLQRNDKYKFIVLTFFSVKCPGCGKDVDFWKALVKAYENKSSKVYLVTPDSDVREVRHFVNAFEFAELPVLYDGMKNRAAGAFDIDILPTTYVFRPNGEVVAKWLGLRWLKDGKIISGEDKLCEIMALIGD